MRYYDFSVPVGGLFTISTSGDYLRYYSGDAGGSDTTLVVMGVDTAAKLLLKPGQSIRLPKTETQWQILNYLGEGTISGFLVIGLGQITDDRITGDVNILSGEVSRTRRGQAYVAYAEILGVAAQYSHVQLWNPIGNPKSLFVESAMFNTDMATPVRVSYGAVQLASLYADPYARSKKLGSPGSVAERRIESKAAISGTTLFNLYADAINKDNAIRFTQPIMIPPGVGMMMITTTLLASLKGSFEFYEEAL